MSRGLGDVYKRQAMADAKAAFDRMDEGRPGDIKLQITVDRD